MCHNQANKKKGETLPTSQRGWSERSLDYTAIDISFSLQTYILKWNAPNLALISKERKMNN